jgi:FMN phosphatase YigB (HAD superfamily)
MTNIRAVGFDLDLTLYRPNEKVTNSICNYIVQVASDFLSKSQKEIRKELKEECESFYVKNKSIRRTLMKIGMDEEQAKIFSQEAVENAKIASYLQKDERLVGMLHRLHEAYELFLITSSSEDNALAKLHALGVNESFFSPRQYGRTNYTRESGSAFEFISSTLGIPSAEMMFVGDREEVDIVPASNMGFMTVLVNHENIQESMATFKIKEIYELEDILKGLSKVNKK